MDTGKDVEGAPMRTLFHLSSHLANSGFLYLQLEWGTHKPSPVESLAPFHQDPTQRIIALGTQYSWTYLVFRVGTLLKLLESREGTEIVWDEWKSHVFTPSINLADLTLLNIRILGCRLFVVCWNISSSGPQLEVYDFSIQGCAKYRTQRVSVGLSGVELKYLASTGARVQIHRDGLMTVLSGHDGLLFSHVSVSAPHSLRVRLNQALLVIPQQLDGDQRVLHVWTF